MEKNNKTRLSKKSSIIILVSLFAAALILTLLNLIDFDKIISDRNKQPQITDFGYSFYESDYESDILSDPEYLVLDRNIAYKSGALTVKPADIRDVAGGIVISDYIDSMISGDAKKYSSLFTDEYISENGTSLPTKFPQQRLYNIEVESIGDSHTYTSDELDGKYTGITRYLFKVTYYIQFNTGTVRKDIPSDSSRPLYFEVFEYRNGQQKINSMLMYYAK